MLSGVAFKHVEDIFAKMEKIGYSYAFLVPVAQLEERQFPKLKVAGSIPVGCARF